MDSQVSGIDKWILGIRSRMANDPGRQDLDDHILCNGFLFLDEYLEDILMGARTEPIIELTKTPGRRKDASKRVRSATTTTIKVTPLVLHSPDKENTPVIKSPAVKKAPTAFQKALLKASKENIHPDVEDHKAPLHKPFQAGSRSPFGRAIQTRDEDAQDEETVNTLITPPLVRVVSGSFLEEPVESPLPYPSAQKLAERSEGAESGVAASEDDRPNPELSTIPEADEAETSRESVTSRHPIIRDNEILYPIPKDPSDPNGPMATVTVSYDPNADDDDDTQAFQTPDDRSFNDSEPTSTASSFPIDPYARDYETHELRDMIGPEQPSESPLLPHSPPAQTLVRKASVPVFPSLPAPSPFRKSVNEYSGGGPSVNNARPSVVPGNGTRTSWLNKTRDVTTKRTSVVSGVKRKSMELASEPSSVTLDNDHSRAKKVAKTSAEGDASWEKPQTKVSIQPFRPVLPTKSREPHFVQAATATTTLTPEGNSEGMMNILKRTVEGLGARVGKSMGKSLGGAAATAAAAEAKAAAEARLAQREAKGSDENRHGRLSVSDLIDVYDSGKGKGKERDAIQPNAERSPTFSTPAAPESRASISTTPPESPPATRNSPSLAPVNTIPKFTVQRPLAQESSFTFPDSQPSTQSTYVSRIFDSQSSWPPSSQSTAYTASQGFSQPEAQAKELSFTRDYTVPTLSKEVGWTQSQPDHPTVYFRASNISQEPQTSVEESQVVQHKDYSQVPGAFEPEDDDMMLGEDALSRIDVDSEGEPIEALHRSTSSPPSDTGTTKNSSQPSSQTGFVAQASGLLSKVMGASVGNALGNSKRGKAEPVKSIQLAAAAAKKQQEEADRKAARLREMDKRRAAIASKKAEQEAADKAKHQGERRKREREEGQEKKVTRATVKKVEEEVIKKRKVVVEIEKKLESKKPISKDKKDLGGSRIGKPMQPGQSTLSKSFKQPGLPASASQSTVKLVGSNQGEPKATPGLPKSESTKDKIVANVIEDVRQPAQALHAQMQARVQVQLMQARQDEPLIPSESIELPDINSEYSNSDDEDRPRTFDPPDWAQSPDLRLALESQSRMNPDDIFGPVRPLRMEEIFPTRQSRFRARTSSANWAGTDEVTRAEEAQYAKRMGYLD